MVQISFKLVLDISYDLQYIRVVAVAGTHTYTSDPESCLLPWNTLPWDLQSGDGAVVTLFVS